MTSKFDRPAAVSWPVAGLGGMPLPLNTRDFVTLREALQFVRTLPHGSRSKLANHVGGRQYGACARDHVPVGMPWAEGSNIRNAGSTRRSVPALCHAASHRPQTFRPPFACAWATCVCGYAYTQEIKREPDVDAISANQLARGAQLAWLL